MWSEQLAHLSRQDAQKVNRHLHIGNLKSAGAGVDGHDVLELRDTLRDVVEALDRANVELLDLAP